MWRDEALRRFSKSPHPLSSPIMGAGCGWVSAPTAPWCRALVATKVVHHHYLFSMKSIYVFLSLLVYRFISHFLMSCISHKIRFFYY